ncbi:MAG: DUF1553 domain-containing protein [Fuerstia sp.]|nr:DUF1553 domain-containing protein [Fuerstiella sp.]
MDDVIIETSDSGTGDKPADTAALAYQSELQRRQDEMKTLTDEIRKLQAAEPGRIAWITDSTAAPPDVFLLDRGEYSQPKDKVEPAPISVLNDDQNPMEILWPAGGFPSSGRRLDAEAIRDAQLAISGELNVTHDGPYVATTRNGAAEVIVPEDHPGAFRRSIYLQQRRSQGLSLLNVFDAPMMVVNCTHRPVTTMPLQSLSLLNSEFAVKRGRSFAERIHREIGSSAEARVRRAFVLATGSECSDEELVETLQFIHDQQKGYASEGDAAESRTWADFCQLLLASNACLYLE